MDESKAGLIYVLTASAMFWTLLLFSLCLSSSPTAADANKYRQLNGSSEEPIDGGGDTSGHDISDAWEVVGEVWATIPGFWLSQLTIDVFELRGGLNDRSRALDLRLVVDRKTVPIFWCRIWSIIWSSSWFRRHLFVSLSGESIGENKGNTAWVAVTHSYSSYLSIVHQIWGVDLPFHDVPLDDEVLGGRLQVLLHVMAVLVVLPLSDSTSISLSWELWLSSVQCLKHRYAFESCFLCN